MERSVQVECSGEVRASRKTGITGLGGGDGGRRRREGGSSFARYGGQGGGNQYPIFNVHMNHQWNIRGRAARHAFRNLGGFCVLCVRQGLSSGLGRREDFGSWRPLGGGHSEAAVARIDLGKERSGLFRTEKFVPGAIQGFLNAHDGCDQDVYAACFNLLNRADVQIGQFRQIFLGDRPRSPLAADVCAQVLKNAFLLDG